MLVFVEILDSGKRFRRNPGFRRFEQLNSALRAAQLELMDRIRPSDDGQLLHYTPSSSVAQTFAKDWTKKHPSISRNRSSRSSWSILA